MQAIVNSGPTIVRNVRPNVFTNRAGGMPSQIADRTAASSTLVPVAVNHFSSYTASSGLSFSVEFVGGCDDRRAAIDMIVQRRDCESHDRAAGQRGRLFPPGQRVGRPVFRDGFFLAVGDRLLS